MTRILFISLLTSYLCSATAQSQCNTPSGKEGQCVSIYNCPSLLKLTSNASAADRALLQSSFCGFSGKVPQVCCPLTVPSCVTPDGAQANCISLYSCPHMLNMLNPPAAESALHFVKKSRCKGPEEYSVCCGPAPAATTTEGPVTPMPNSGGSVENGQCVLTAFPPDPSTNCCGIDASGGGNRIIGGTAAALDEYPWLALIEYERDGGIELLCGGVLISGRYVMTAGHCVVRRGPHPARPVNVRLGEHDTANNGPDCVDVEGGGSDCNEGTTIVPIETTIVHPEYNSSFLLRRHDIALIRLARVVEYTDFIRPICLPTTDFTEAPSGRQVMLHVAGWGAVNDTKSSSNIKLKVGLPYVSYQDCQPSYNVLRRKVQLWDGQICAGGEVGKDSCKGDSGGPLMRENGRLFELVGIVSFGPMPCGIEDVAGVYSKVHKYLPWIRSQITA